METTYFDDLAEGQPLACQPVTFSKDGIIEFAKTFDPQPFHIDEAAAKRSVFRGLVASSLHTLSACTRAVVEAQGRLAVLSGICIHEVNMYHPVRPGDTLFVKAFWARLERSKSRSDRGTASIMCEVYNQNHETVITHGYRYILACRPSGTGKFQ
jgi:acyl dehydratase